MQIQIIKDKILSLASPRNLIIGIALLAIVGLVFVAYQCRPNGSTTDLTTEMSARIQELVDQQLKDKLVPYDNELKTLKMQMSESKRKSANQEVEIKKIKEKGHEALPSNRTELYNLLNRLGYPPIGK